MELSLVSFLLWTKPGQRLICILGDSLLFWSPQTDHFAWIEGLCLTNNAAECFGSAILSTTDGPSFYRQISRQGSEIFLQISCKFLPKIFSNQISGGPATLAQRAWSEPTQNEGPKAPVWGAWAAIWSWGQNSDIIVIRSFAQLRFARWRSSIGCFIVFLLYMFFFLILYLCPDKPLHAGSCNILSFSIHMFVKVTVFYRSLTVKWKRLFQMPLRPSFRQYCTQGKEKQMSHTGNTQSRHRDHLMRKKLERKKGLGQNPPTSGFLLGWGTSWFLFFVNKQQWYWYLYINCFLEIPPTWCIPYSCQAALHLQGVQWWPQFPPQRVYAIPAKNVH